MRKIFVTGIGTDVGKTIISAILTEALQADYWKPIQCGSLKLTDTDRVKRLVSSSSSFFHPEAYQFEQALSPHEAAELSGIKIKSSKLSIPETENTLIIEGAGGILVPFNNKGDSFIDLIKSVNAEVVVVSKNYLGSINHSLLTLEYLKQKNVSILGIIFNGEANLMSENVIINQSKVNLLGKIPEEFEISKDLIKKYAHDYIFI